MKSRKAKREGAVRPFDLTPMIDVVLQLIIFFMFTTQFGDLIRSEIDLPRQDDLVEGPDQEPRLIIDINSDGSFVVESSIVTPQQVRSLLDRIVASSDRDTAVVLIRPDRTVAARSLNRLVELLADAGVSRASIATVEGGR